MKLTLYNQTDIDVFLSLMQWREAQRLEELRLVLVRARRELTTAIERTQGETGHE